MTDNSNMDEAQKAAAAAAANPQGGQGGSGDDNQKDPAVLLRHEQQKNGQLTEQFRHVLVAAFKEGPQKGLDMLDGVDPRITERVISDLGYKSREEFVANRNSSSPAPTISRDEIASIVQEMNTKSALESTQAAITSEFAKLPPEIKEVVEKEFSELVEGRQLTPEQMKSMARKALYIGQGAAGSYTKIAQMQHASLNLGGSATPIGQPKDAAAEILGNMAKIDPFWGLSPKK